MFFEEVKQKHILKLNKFEPFWDWIIRAAGYLRSRYVKVHGHCIFKVIMKFTLQTDTHVLLCKNTNMCICVAPHVATCIFFVALVFLHTYIAHIDYYQSPTYILSYSFCWPSQHTKRCKEYSDNNLFCSPLENQKFQ